MSAVFMPKPGPAVDLTGKSEGSNGFSTITAIPNSIHDLILRVRGGGNESHRP